MVLIGASFMPARGGDVTVTTPRELDASRPPASCPVTIPEGNFVPPERYRSGFDAGPGKAREWYGSEDLWVVLDRDGEVWLPHAGHPGNPKLFLWSLRQGGAQEEPRPDVKLTAERIDADTPIAHNDRTTHGFVDSNLFMITSIILPTPGCWGVTAEYRGASLSWVVWAGDVTSQ